MYNLLYYGEEIKLTKSKDVENCVELKPEPVLQELKLIIIIKGTRTAEITINLTLNMFQCIQMNQK